MSAVFAFSDPFFFSVDPDSIFRREKKKSDAVLGCVGRCFVVCWAAGVGNLISVVHSLAKCLKARLHSIKCTQNTTSSLGWFLLALLLLAQVVRAAAASNMLYPYLLFKIRFAC